MEILFLILGITLAILAAFSIGDDSPMPFAIFATAAVACLLIFVLNISAPRTFDVSCGENTYQAVQIQIDDNYLEIIQPGEPSEYEDGPCEWERVK